MCHSRHWTSPNSLGWHARWWSDLLSLPSSSVSTPPERWPVQGLFYDLDLGKILSKGEKTVTQYNPVTEAEALWRWSMFV